MFTALLVVALWKFDVVLDVLKSNMGDPVSVCTWRSDRICDQRANELLERKCFGRAKKEIR